MAGVAAGWTEFRADGTNEVVQREPVSSSPVMDYFANWFDRVAKTQAEQPHWAPPVATTSPYLQEVLRYDIMRESLKSGRTLTIYGSGKGLEFIPAERLQVIIGVPPGKRKTPPRARTAGRTKGLLVKYRLLSANEQEGNYVLTLFGGLTVPTGSESYTTRHYVFPDGGLRQRVGGF